jgi:hypothetical protein
MKGYDMSNLSTINHKSFEKLHELTQNYNKAIFLDKCLFWFQISKYTLGDGKIWFTRSIPTMAKELNLSERSVNRFLKEFSEKGYIEKINKLFIKKHLYIRVTDKLLQLIVNDQWITTENNPIKNQKKNSEDNQNSVFLKQDDIIENDNLSGSIYKDPDHNSLVNNTVSEKNNIKTKKIKVHSIYPQYPIEKVIGERLNQREKNYIKGMMHNVLLQHQVHFSSPEQLFAEIVFTVLNVEQLSGINNFNHRVQIIAKLLRQKKWLTPKGFYNHADFGAPFRKTTPKNEPPQKTLLSVFHQPSNNIFQLEKQIKNNQDELNQINRELNQEKCHLNNLNTNKHNNQYWSEALVTSITNTIKRLEDKKEHIKSTLEQLQAQQNPQKQNNKPFVLPKAKNHWEYYDFLCEQQKTIESLVDKTRNDYERALIKNPWDSILVETCCEKYHQQMKELEELNNEIFELGDYLFAGKVA